MLLDRIKKFGNTCPICNRGMSTDIIVETQFGNRHYFGLTAATYPLRFKRFTPFSDQVESIYIDENDCISIPLSCVKVRLSSACNFHGHYRCIFVSMEGSPPPAEWKEVKLSGWMQEEISIGDFMVRSIIHSYRTVILKRGKYGNFNKLLTIPLRTSEHWPLQDLNAFKEKIDKLLLLS